MREADGNAESERKGKKGIINPDKWEMGNSLVDSTEPHEQLS